MTICSVLDGLIDTEEKLKEAIRRFEEAQAQSKASTLNMLRGRIKSRRDGRCAYTFQIPYGIDRLYTTAEGGPLHIIRNLADGRQLQLDPTGQTVLREFEPNEDGLWKHYVKQRDEYITLIPGDPERVAVLRRIFRRKFVDGWGQYKIARELNDEGIVSPKGLRWAGSTLQQMLQNSVFFGIGIGNRKSKAIFYKAGKTMPQSVVWDTGKRKDKKDRRPLEEYRPETEWFEQICPQLEKSLKAQRQSVDEQIDFYVNQMAFLGTEGVRGKTDPLRRKLLDLSRRIEAAEWQSEASKLDVADIAEAVKENCRKVFTSLDGLSQQQIRNLVKSLVTKVVVDLETREAVMEVQMPLWAIGTGRNVIDDVCVVDASCRTDGNHANTGLLIPLASYACTAQRVNKQFCMACQRTRRVPATATPAPESVLVAA